MHIPDGYLSPATCVAFYAAMAPVWYFSAKKFSRELQPRTTAADGTDSSRAGKIPMLALSAAFSFVIMMFNIPIPGGSSGHMTGGALAALVLGPWGAVISITTALAIQALLFGDGGVTTLGTNCFNLAFIMPFTGFHIYRILIAGNASPRRRWAALFIAGYVSINAAALATAFEIGIQPAIASAPDGRPLYAPYPLSVTIPAMTFSHLLFIGFIEAAGTAVVVSYIFRMNKSLLYKEGRVSLKPLWAWLAILILLTPIGLLAGGTAWGEWAAEELAAILGFVPEGLKGIEGLWTSLMPDYGITGSNDTAGTAFNYILSAAVGSLIIVMTIFLAGKIWKRK